MLKTILLLVGLINLASLAVMEKHYHYHLTGLSPLEVRHLKQRINHLKSAEKQKSKADDDSDKKSKDRKKSKDDDDSDKKSKDKKKSKDEDNSDKKSKDKKRKLSTNIDKHRKTRTQVTTTATYNNKAACQADCKRRYPLYKFWQIGNRNKCLKSCPRYRRLASHLSGSSHLKAMPPIYYSDWRRLNGKAHRVPWYLIKRRLNGRAHQKVYYGPRRRLVVDPMYVAGKH